MDRKSLEFTVFMIHALAASWKKSCKQVYQILNDTGILDSYILPYYDVLHTQGEQYLVDDITGFVKDKGVKI
ncbi:MAG: DUF3791 domain-containing protein [Candidatus Weimeria sp.]